MRHQAASFIEACFHLPLGVFRTTPDGTILAANEAALAILGYESMEELQRVNAADLYVRPARRLELMDSLAKTRTVIGEEVELRRKDGSTVWCSTNITAVIDQERHTTYYDGILLDITQRKQTERLLRNQQERLELALEGAQLATWDENMQTRTVTRDARWAETLGYTPEEIGETDTEWKELIHPDDQPAVERAIKEYESGQSPFFRLEHRLRTKSGDWKWILNWGRILEWDEEGRPVRAAGVHQDVTEQRRAQEALRASEKKYRLLFDNAGVGIGYITIEGEILSFNRTAAEFMGGKPDEFIGKSFYDLYPRADADVHTHRLHEAATIDETLEFLDCAQLPGKKRWFHSFYTPIRDDDGEIQGVQIIAHDVTARVEAEEARREAERQKDIVLNSTSETFAYYTPDMKVVWANKAAAHSVGKTVDELVGKQCYELWRQRSEPCENCPVIRAEKTGTPQEAEHVTPDGRHWLLRGYPVFAEKETLIGLVEFGQDITDRVNAERTLQAERDRAQNFLDIAGTIIIALNTRGEVTMINQRGCEILNSTKEDVLGVNWIHTFLPEEVRSEVYAGFEQLIRGDMGEYEHHDNPVITTTGERRDIHWHNRVLYDETGKSIGTLSSGEDITEQKKAETALRHSEQRFRLIAETIQDVFLVVTPDYSEVIYVSPMYEKIWGRSRDSLKQHPRSWLDALPKKDRNIVWNYISEHMNMDFEMLTIPEYRVIRPDGSTRWIHARYFPVRDTEGRLSQIVGIAVDITERKEAELRIQHYQKQLREMSAEISLTEERERRRLAAGIHDDIAQPLVFTNMELTTLLRDPELPEPLVAQITPLQEQLKLAIDRVRSLSFELSPPVLYELGFAEAIDWLAEETEKQHGIHTEFSGTKDLPLLPDDTKVTLYQAARELMINAVKHAQANQLKVTLTRKKDQVRLQITDNGVGFEPSSVDTRRDTHGGFGLFNIRERMKLLDGEIIIDSQPGSGSRVTLIAPISERRNTDVGGAHGNQGTAGG